ncbi:MAG: hypothetical protein ACKVOY_13685 [Burkholderiaceae bacterium]
MSQFTVTVKGAGLIDSTTEKSIIQAATYVGNLLDRYIIWKGVLDIEIQVKPASALTWATANGLFAALGQITWTGSGSTNSTLEECLTGVDANTQLPDAGSTIYLGSDGTIRIYDSPVWFDPNPQFDVKPDLPKGYVDFIGLLTHEIFHCLGFYAATDQWKKFVVKDGTQSYFDGPITKSLLGGALTLVPTGNNDHYGNIALATNNAPRGLMWQFGNYELNRLDIGRIDLAVLQDLGYQIKTYEGLPLFELSDSYPNITGTWASETLYGNYQANVISGLYGNDIIDGGAGIDTAKYINAKSKYKLNFLSSANKSLTEVSGPEGFDTLISIERLKFSDASVAIDLDGNAGITAKILGAVLGKQSLTNKSYVGIGLSYLDAGWSYGNLASLALDAAGAKTNDQIVSLLWTNVIGTKPTAADKAPFIALLENGMTAGALAHLAADTSFNTTNINLIGLAQTGIEYIPVS